MLIIIVGTIELKKKQEHDLNLKKYQFVNHIQHNTNLWDIPIVERLEMTKAGNSFWSLYEYPRKSGKLLYKKTTKLKKKKLKIRVLNLNFKIFELL